MFQLCVSQQLTQEVSPFSFKATGIRVYSFEEVYYHVYHYWKESVDDFLSDAMITWVSELGHSYLAAKMKELTKTEPFTERILDFLRLIDYFNNEELENLQEKLIAWEERREWEKLKERADHLISRGEPAKALALYKRALQYDENPILLNNMGVAYMQLSQPKEALRRLTRALTLDTKNTDILLHYIEAAILSKNYDNATAALKKAEATMPSNSDIPFFYGLMAYYKKDYTLALKHFSAATEINPQIPHYVYKIADVHKAIRQYDKALSTLNQVTQKDSTYYAKQAELYASAGDIPAAIRSMQNAVKPETADANLWARLAGYYRQDYDPKRAEESIKKAINLAPDNDLVLLENARIKKGLGRTREYQAALNDVLKGFKDRYRAEL